MDYRRIVEETIRDVVIEEMVKEVLRRLESIPKKALVLFTGGSIGFKDSVAQVNKLKEGGWHLKILLSKSAERVLTKNLMEKLMGSENVEIHVESQGKNSRYYYKDIDKVIVPVLTMNTAAKIAQGISDTMITNLLSHALMANIPIVAAKNACDPLDEERVSLGLGKGSIPYIHTLKNHLALMESYGIKLVSANQIYDAVTGKSHQNGKNIKTQTIFEKNVLTRGDMAEVIRLNRELVVSHKTIITPAARDMAKSFGIKILIQ